MERVNDEGRRAKVDEQDGTSDGRKAPQNRTLRKLATEAKKSSLRAASGRPARARVEVTDEDIVPAYTSNRKQAGADSAPACLDLGYGSYESYRVATNAELTKAFCVAATRL